MFLHAGSGKISMVRFNGQPVAEKELLDKSKFEDGDLFAGVSDDGKKIFAVANKFQLPMARDTLQGPVFYAFDSKMRSLAADTLSFVLATGLDASPDGRFAILQTEMSDGTTPMVVVDPHGKEILQFQFPIGIRFARDSKRLLYVPRVGQVEILSTDNWRQLYLAQVRNPRFTWLDYDISDDGAYAVLFNADEIVLLDIANNAWIRTSFPFSFTHIYLTSGGQRMILTGEFGYCAYDLVFKRLKGDTGK
jgi:hypothetical protein